MKRIAMNNTHLMASLVGLLTVALYHHDTLNEYETIQELPASNVIAIEEDWELVVSEASVALSAPQIVTQMDSQSTDDPVTFYFLINHGTLPEESLGGMQVQAWRDEIPQKDKMAFAEKVFSHGNETVTWTQRIATVEGQMYYSIRNFSSLSFGNFVTNSDLQIKIATTASNLNKYSHLNSVQRSQISFASNRVNSMKLRKVRIHHQDGTVQELVVNLAVELD